MGHAHKFLSVKTADVTAFTLSITTTKSISSCVTTCVSVAASVSVEVSVVVPVEVTDVVAFFTTNSLYHSTNGYPICEK